MRFILISNTRYKLNAAKYHLQRMREIQSSRDYYHFKYELDAFLSAARSITSLPAERGKKDSWYLEKEFCHRPNFQKWYDKKVEEFKADTSMHFMNDERANAVHYNYQSSRARAETMVNFTNPLTVSDSFIGTVTNIDGTTETVSSQSDPTPEKPIETSTERIWFFDTDKIMGDKSVIVACEEHIRKLEKIVDEVERL